MQYKYNIRLFQESNIFTFLNFLFILIKLKCTRTYTIVYLFMMTLECSNVLSLLRFKYIALHIRVLNCTNKQQLRMYWCH